MSSSSGGNAMLTSRFDLPLFFNQGIRQPEALPFVRPGIEQLSAA